MSINWNVLATSIATAIILGIFAYITNTQNKLQLSMSELLIDQRVAAEQMVAVRSSLQEIKDVTSDRYTAIEIRIRELERGMDRMISEQEKGGQ